MPTGTTRPTEPAPGLLPHFATAPATIASLWEDHNRHRDEGTCPDCGEPTNDNCPYGGCWSGEHCDQHCGYETGHTDWDHVYPHLGHTIHRGMSLRLDHDRHAEPHQIAAHIADFLHKNPGGTHWSDNENLARHYAVDSAYPGDTIHVVLHAAKPDRDDIETDPHELLRGDVLGYDKHQDREIPLTRGAPVHITGASWCHPDNQHNWIHHDFPTPIRHTAMCRIANGKTWLPHDRFFGPGEHDLDPRLFDGDHLKPAWRHALYNLAARALNRYGPEWHSWARVYLAGSQASHWYGNNDLDVLIGVNYDQFRSADPARAAMSDTAIDEMLNASAHEVCDPARYFDIDGQHLGPFDSTVYVNHDSYDIRRIKPYAAYDLTDDRWAVRPVEVPDDFGPELLPSADFKYARSLADQVKALKKLPAGQGQSLGAALYDQLHGQRHEAFSGDGEGLYDPRNIAWKYLDQHPDHPMEQLVNWKRAAEQPKTITAVFEHPALENPASVQQDHSRRKQYNHDMGLPDLDHHEWFHGTTRLFDHPEVDDRAEQGRVGEHWNTALGSHWASSHTTADGFAQPDPDSEGPSHARTFHARLRISNPKRYDSEFDMDREAFAYEYDAGNHRKSLDPDVDEDFDPDLRHQTRPWDHTQRGHDFRFARWLSTHPDRHGIAARFKKRLVDAGHDGVVYGNRIEQASDHNETEHARNNNLSAIAFHPCQVEITQVHRPGTEHCLQGQDARDVAHPRPGQPALPGMGPGLEHLAGKGGASDASFAKSSMMIALVPPRTLAEGLVEEDGEPVDKMHITLAYLPHVEPHDTGRIAGVVAEWASRHRAPQCRVQGAGTFVAAPGDAHVLWAAVDIKRSSYLHSSLVDALKAAGFAPAEDHGFCAHLTLAYRKHHVRFLPKIQPTSFTCDVVWVCRGKDWRPVPFGGATASAAGANV